MTSTKIVVESGIPLPDKFPFKQMQVGDSFVIPESIKRTNVIVAARRFGEKYGAKFITRKMPNGEVRCWRIQ